MLQQEDLKKIDAVLEDTAGQRGVLISVLQRVQEKVGYLPEDAMKMIARINRVAKFMNPPGRIGH